MNNSLNNLLIKNLTNIKYFFEDGPDFYIVNAKRLTDIEKFNESFFKLIDSNQYTEEDVQMNPILSLKNINTIAKLKKYLLSQSESMYNIAARDFKMLHQIEKFNKDVFNKIVKTKMDIITSIIPLKDEKYLEEVSAKCPSLAKIIQQNEEFEKFRLGQIKLKDISSDTFKNNYFFNKIKDIIIIKLVDATDEKLKTTQSPEEIQDIKDELDEQIIKMTGYMLEQIEEKKLENTSKKGNN